MGLFGLLLVLAFLAWLDGRRERNALFGDQPCHSCGATIRWDGGRKMFVHKASRRRFEPPIPDDDLHGWLVSKPRPSTPVPHPAEPWWHVL